MPWTITDVDKHKKGLTDENKKRWVSIANGVLASCKSKGGSDSDCDAMAIRVANSKVNVNMEISVNNELEVGDYVVERKEVNNRTYLVVPVIMMVEGVHNGSRGAVYHSCDELRKSASDWNGKPVTISHPAINGQYVSANSESILKDWGVGHIENARMDGVRLKGDAWLDEQKLIGISPDTLLAINDGKILEVSLGLFSEEDEISGVWNGEEYITSAFNYIPDHLALLPEEIGACSVMDGCGIRVNKSNKSNGGIENVNKFELLKGLKQDESVFPIVYANGLKETVEKVRDSLYSRDSISQEYYLEEVYDEFFVYRMASYDVIDENKGMRKFKGEQLYKQGYNIDNNGVVNFVGSPEKVVRKIDYISANKSKEEAGMCKTCKEKASALIANTHTHFDENDREWLESLTEDKLDKMIPMVKTVEKVIEANVTKEKALEVLGIEKNQYEKGLEIYNAKRAEVVKSILDNTKDVWVKEELDAMKLETLQRIDNSITKENPVYFAGNNKPNSDYEVKPMPMPGVEFEESK